MLQRLSDLSHSGRLLYSWAYEYAHEHLRIDYVWRYLIYIDGVRACLSRLPGGGKLALQLVAAAGGAERMMRSTVANLLMVFLSSGTGRIYQDGYNRIPSSFANMAVDNFQKEWAALRRSFREDEYGKVAAVNPASGVIGRLGHAIGSTTVRAVAALDLQLEKLKFLGALTPTSRPEDGIAVGDDEERETLTAECGCVLLGFRVQCPTLLPPPDVRSCIAVQEWETRRKRQGFGNCTKTALS